MISLSQAATPHGTIARPIPVPIGVDEDLWEQDFVSSRVRGAQPISREILVENGRTYYKCLARDPEGKPHLFLFDVTVRQYRPSVAPQIILTEEMKRRLSERVQHLPATGCFLCLWIFRAVGPRGELKKTAEGLAIVSQVRHLALEEIATFVVPCSQCGQPLSSHLAFDSDDLSSCRLCDAIRMAVARETSKNPVTPEPFPRKKRQGRH